MHFDRHARVVGVGTDVTATKPSLSRRLCEVSFSRVFVLALCASMLGAACSGGGGATGGKGGAGAAHGGTGGIGGTVDAGLPDAPADTATTDVPIVACASGDCCPDDPLKTQPGVCGCGTADMDSDYDGVLDCKDGCAEDPLKTAPGACGCFIADTDSDGDGTADCVDRCPKDATRKTPGVCGCGVSDAVPLCLAHRYSFNDTSPAVGGTTDGGGVDAEATDAAAIDGGVARVTDSVGGAHGIAVGFAQTGSGSVTLAGGTSDEHIELPPGLISSLGDSGTFEAWVTWPGTGGFWQRIFDFGANDGMPPSTQGIGNSFLFCTPQGLANGVLLVSMVTATGGLREIPAPAVFPSGTMQHLAVVVDNQPTDGGSGTLLLYLNGALVGQVPGPSRLSDVNDVHNWLGKSQFLLDPEFAGTYHEFRIYSTARSAAQIMASFTAGPDALPAE